MSLPIGWAPWWKATARCTCDGVPVRVHLCAVLLAVGIVIGSASGQEEFSRQFNSAQAETDPELRRGLFMQAYSSFLRIDPDSEEYREFLAAGARSAFEGGSFGDAASLFAEQWDRAGASPELLELRLNALSRAGQEREAVELGQLMEREFDAVVKSWMGTLANYQGLASFAGRLLLAEDPGGLWIFTKLVEAYPGNPRVTGDLALTHRLLGQVEKAERLYGEAILSAAGDAGELSTLWVDYGLSRKGRGYLDEAAEAFLAALGHEPQPGQSAAGANLAILFQRTGMDRGRDVVGDLQSSLRLQPESVLPRRLLLDALAGR